MKVDNELLEKRGLTACFTGHRSLPKGDEFEVLKGKTEAMIKVAYSVGFRIFITGGAVGYDTLAAKCVIKLMDELPGIELHLALPCRNQTEKWCDLGDLVTYKRIKGFAKRIDYVTDFYNDTCMLERNRYMVDRSGLCIAYCTKDRGGSAYTVRYAKKEGLGVVNVGTNSYSLAELQKSSAR